MAKRDDRIITSVYLAKEMCSQIDKMADRGHISRNEQIRRYIEKGLAVEGYSQDIDLIAGIIRQEMQAVCHILKGYLGGRGGRKIFPLSGANPAPVKRLLDGQQGKRVYGTTGTFITLHPVRAAFIAVPKSLEVALWRVSL